MANFLEIPVGTIFFWHNPDKAVELPPEPAKTKMGTTTFSYTDKCRSCECLSKKTLDILSEAQKCSGDSDMKVVYFPNVYYSPFCII